MMLSVNRTLSFVFVQRNRPVLLHPTIGRVPRYLSSSNEIDNSTPEALDNDQKQEEEIGLRAHRVTWKTADGNQDVSFDAFDGELLRTAALRRQVVSPHNGRARLINCRGLGTCGTCAVEILNGALEPTEQNAIEQLRLSLPPHSSSTSKNKRLACQIQVRGDMTVTKYTGFWGQHGEVAEKSEADTFAGELEFLFDNRSPESKSKPNCTSVDSK